MYLPSQCYLRLLKLTGEDCVVISYRSLLHIAAVVQSSLMSAVHVPELQCYHESHVYWLYIGTHCTVFTCSKQYL